MNIEELSKKATSWANEKEDDRAIIVIAIEKNGETDKGFSIGVTQQIEGQAKLCFEGLKTVLSNSNEENVFPELLKRAQIDLLTRKLFKKICDE